MNERNNKLELLGSAPIPKALMALGIPIMIGMLINALYNLVDAYFVSGLGKSQMGAISVVFPLGQVVVGLGLMFGNGAASYLSSGNVKKCAVGKHPKSEKHGNTAQFSEAERSGTQENCGGIGSGCRLRLRPLPVLHRRQSQRVARIDPNAVVVDKNIAENDRFDLFSR